MLKDFKAFLLQTNALALAVDNRPTYVLAGAMMADEPTSGGLPPVAISAWNELSTLLAACCTARSRL